MLFSLFNALRRHLKTWTSVSFLIAILPFQSTPRSPPFTSLCPTLLILCRGKSLQKSLGHMRAQFVNRKMNSQAAAMLCHLEWILAWFSVFSSGSGEERHKDSGESSHHRVREITVGVLENTQCRAARLEMARALGLQFLPTLSLHPAFQIPLTEAKPESLP